MTAAPAATANDLTAAQEAALHMSPRAKLEILGAMLLAMFLFALDQTVVGSATDIKTEDFFARGRYVSFSFALDSLPQGLPRDQKVYIERAAQTG